MKIILSKIKEINYKKVIIFSFLILLFYISFVIAFQISIINQRHSGVNIVRFINLFLKNIKSSFFNNPFLLLKMINNKKQLFKIQFVIYIVSLIYIISQILVNKKSEYKNIEKGSAGFATAKERKEYGVDKIDNNIILSETEAIPLNFHKIYKNGNNLIIGGSGAGKSDNYVLPNVLQFNSNYILTDSKGTLFKKLAKPFRENGYDVKVLNTKDVQYSNNYNIFKYISKTIEIPTIAKSIIVNTEDPNRKGGDDFWPQNCENLLKALMYYTFEMVEKSERNLSYCLNLLLTSTEVDEGDSELTQKFNLLKEINPSSQAVKFYSIFMQAKVDTRREIRISLCVRLSWLVPNEIQELTNTDNINIDNVEKKKVIFVIMSDSDKTNYVIASIFFTQLFQRFYYLADNNYEDEKLPICWQFILDEFANIGQIPGLAEKMSTLRSRNIKLSPIIQAKSQLKEIYKESTETIVGNCDATVYLGGNDLTTAKEISEKLGKTTINVINRTTTKSNKDYSSANNIVKSERLLKSPDELLRLKGQESIVIIKGFNPFLSQKFNLKKHKNYKYLSKIYRTNIKEKGAIT